jgi:hypothetical protein
VSKDPNELFFTQSDRLVVGLPSLNQVNLNFRSPLREKFGDAIDNLIKNESSSSKDEIQLILTVSEHLLKSIFKYNKEFINHSLNHMLKLDDKLANKLLVHLWQNEMCEKYVQVPCTSILNPMHQCVRPAMVKFVYEVATKRDQLKQEMRENRLNHDKLIGNFIELNAGGEMNNQMYYDQMSKFPHDDVIISMVAMNQLIKKLLKSSHTKSAAQQQEQKQQGNHGLLLLLSRLFYLLIDMYESQMNHPNDVLNPAKCNSASPMHLTGWSILIDDYPSLTSQQHTHQQQINSDSIHLFMFDLIHLMGANFIQKNSIRNVKKSNQQLLLEKIICKLTSTINLSSILVERNAGTNGGATAGAISTRRSSNMLLSLTRNKLSLMSLCAQYVEPNDLDLFNEFYQNILCSISSILLNETNNRASETTMTSEPLAAAAGNDNQSNPLPRLDENEMLNQKFGIILQLLGKFSFINLNRLLESSDNLESVSDICTQFVNININFLTDLNLDCLTSSGGADVAGEQIAKRDLSLRQIIDQCIENFVSILNVSYPFYFDYMLRQCLEFSSKPFALKYGTAHLTRFVTIFQQNELLCNLNSDVSRFLVKSQYESVMSYLGEFFAFERSRFRAQKTQRSFISHWSMYTRQLGQLFSTLMINYFDKYVAREITDNTGGVGGRLG